jgi:uncharacterized membrane protein
MESINMTFYFPYAGEVYSTSCALLWALSIILFRQSRKWASPIVLNLFKCSLSLPFYVVTLFILNIDLFPAENSQQDWIILLVSGVIGLGIADSLFFASLNRLGVGRSAIVDCLYSPFVVLCSFLYLNEPMGPSLFLAIGLMVAAIFIGTWQPEKNNQTKPSKAIIHGILLGALSMSLMAVGIVMAKPIMNRSDPWWTTTVRLSGGVIFLAIQVIFSNKRQEFWRCVVPGPHWKLLIPTAILGTYITMVIWMMGMTYTEATTASVLNQLSTIFALILATLLLKEPLTLRKIIAIFMGFSGGVLAVL